MVVSLLGCVAVTDAATSASIAWVAGTLQLATASRHVTRRVSGSTSTVGEKYRYSPAAIISRALSVQDSTLTQSSPSRTSGWHHPAAGRDPDTVPNGAKVSWS